MGCWPQDLYGGWWQHSVSSSSSFVVVVRRPSCLFCLSCGLLTPVSLRRMAAASGVRDKLVYGPPSLSELESSKGGVVVRCCCCCCCCRWCFAAAAVAVAVVVVAVAVVVAVVVTNSPLVVSKLKVADFALSADMVGFKKVGV